MQSDREQTFGNFHGSGLGGWLVLRHEVADGTYSGERTTYALDEGNEVGGDDRRKGVTPLAGRQLTVLPQSDNLPLDGANSGALADCWPLSLSADGFNPAHGRRHSHEQVKLNQRGNVDSIAKERDTCKAIKRKEIISHSAWSIIRTM